MNDFHWAESRRLSVARFQGAAGILPTRQRRLSARSIPGGLILLAVGWFASGVSIRAAAPPRAPSRVTNSPPALTNTPLPTNRRIGNRIRERKPAPALTNTIPPGFRIEKGFRLDTVASEPLVDSPVAMAFDAAGRLFVAEMPGYTGGPNQLRRPGQIVLLEDQKGQGHFTHSAVFADGLTSPSALACYNGGLFVGAGPNILYLKDKTGDGKADSQSIVFTGFEALGNAGNPNGLLNNFKWGPDHRIHGATGGLGGLIKTSGAQDTGVVSIDGQGFSFDPRTLAIAPEAGPGLSGLCFDSVGREFLSDFTRPLRFPMYALRYLERNPYAPAPPELIDAEPPATTVFRLPPAGAAQARKLKTSNMPAARPAGAANALTPTWLTTAQGCTIYRGDCFPRPYLGNVFIADPADHLIHRAVLNEQGLAPRASRAPNERDTEFLLSSDPSFRPVQIINGPDGALYVADCGEGRGGHIYRIAPANFVTPKPVRLNKAITYALVLDLASRNGWRRQTAARLLYERQQAGAAWPLTNMLNRSQLPLARLEALHALDAIGTLDEAEIFKALNDPDAEVRRQGLMLSENLAAAGPVSSMLWTQIRKAVVDSSPAVRRQLAWSLGEFQNPGKARVLAQILARDVADPWVRAAALTSLATGGANELQELSGLPLFLRREPGQVFLKELGTMIGAAGRLDEVARAMSFLARAKLQPIVKFALLGAIGEGLHRTGSSLALVDTQKLLDPIYAQALTAAPDDSLAPPLRIAALGLLGVSPYSYGEVRAWLLPLLNRGEPLSVQLAAMANIGRYDDPQLAPDILQEWPALSPALRGAAVTALLFHSDRTSAVVKALESGKIPPSDLSSIQKNLLRSYPDPDLARRSLRLLGPTVLHRPTVVARFLPAERLAAAVGPGRQIFMARCAACHRLGGHGAWFGPDLAGVKINGRDYILKAVLEPNLRPRPGYTTTVVETANGERYVGIIAHETPITLTLRQPGRVDIVLPRGDVESVTGERWSFMPVGLEQGLSAQAMADLLGYIMSTPR
jgi:putative membrane-bound dehydrogenase-like protein